MATAQTVIVYSKPGCDRCEKAKAKLEKMGVDFEVRDLAESVAFHEGWNEDGTVERMAAWAGLNQTVPLIQVGDEYYDYPGGMKAVKSGQS